MAPPFDLPWWLAEMGLERVFNSLLFGEGGIASVHDDFLLRLSTLLDRIRPSLSEELRGEILFRHWLYNGQRPDAIDEGYTAVLASASVSLRSWFESVRQSQTQIQEPAALSASDSRTAHWIAKRVNHFQRAHGIIPVVKDNAAFPVPFEISGTPAEICFIDENGGPIPDWEENAGHLWTTTASRRVQVFHPNGINLTGGSFALPLLLAIENHALREISPRSILATGAIGQTGIVDVEYYDLKRELANKLGVRLWIQPGHGPSQDDALFIAPGTAIQQALAAIRGAPQYQLLRSELGVPGASDSLLWLLERRRFDENDIVGVERCLRVLENAEDPRGIYKARLVEGRAHLAALYNHAGRTEDANRILTTMAGSANRSFLFQGRPMGKRVENLTDMGRLGEAREFGARFVQFVEAEDDETEAWRQLKLEAHGSFGGGALGHTALRTGNRILIQEGKAHLERCLEIAADLRELNRNSTEHFKSAARLLLWKVFFQPSCEVLNEIAEQEGQAVAEPDGSTVQFLRRYRFVLASRWILQGRDPADLNWNLETEWPLPELTHDFLRWVRASALRGLGALYATRAEIHRAEDCFREALDLLRNETGPVLAMVRWSVAAQAVWSLDAPGDEGLRVLQEDLGGVLQYLRADETGIQLASTLESCPEDRPALRDFLLQHPY